MEEVSFIKSVDDDGDHAIVGLHHATQINLIDGEAALADAATGARMALGSRPGLTKGSLWPVKFIGRRSLLPSSVGCGFCVFDADNSAGLGGASGSGCARSSCVWNVRSK